MNDSTICCAQPKRLDVLVRSVINAFDVERLNNYDETLLGDLIVALLVLPLRGSLALGCGLESD